METVAKLLNMKQSAAFLGVSLDTIRRRRTAGRLPDRARYTEEELRASEPPARKGTPRPSRRKAQGAAQGAPAPTDTPPDGREAPGGGTPPPGPAGDPWALNLPRDVKPAKAGTPPPADAPASTEPAPAGDFFDW